MIRSLLARSRIAIVLSLLATVLGVMPTSAAASPPVLNGRASYGFTAANCPTTITHDTVTVTGIAPTQTLDGSIRVEFVVDTGRIPIKQSVTSPPSNTDPP